MNETETTPPTKPTDGNQPVIELENVCLSYGDTGESLHGINLTVDRGECVLLCGRSGCGKTTITKCINGLIPHFEESARRTGTVTVAGMDVDHMEMYEMALKVGSVFQNPKSQFFNLTSSDELAFGLESAGVDPDYINDRIDTTVRELHAENLLHRNVIKMSGGEKQSLIYASIHVMDPDVYVLDEPTANLDAAAIQTLHDHIARTKREGKTIIIAEHRLYFLTDLIDRALLIEDGSIVREYTREEFRSLSEEQCAAMGLRTLDPTASLADGINGHTLPRCPSKPSESGLSVRNVACEFKDQRILEHIDMTAKRGVIVGLVGDNGSGKTTLLRCLAGLERDRVGEIYLDGRRVRCKERNRKSYLIMQDVNHQLFSDSVENECRLSAPHASQESIDGMLDSLDLLHLKDRHPLALSGGQKQRLAIATGLLADKQILLFDEPTSGLDFAHMLEVSALMHDLARRNVVMVIATHDREFLDRSCDCVFELPRNV